MRVKEFDPEAALRSAMEVFWVKGFEGTSLDDLMHAMGIARQSLYDTFGDKRALYLKALVHYRDESHAGMRTTFAEAKTVKHAFATLLYGLAGETRAQHQRGCLLLSANIEHASSDPEIARFLRGNQATVQDIFRAAIERAQKRGEVAADKDAAALARFFIVTIQGMRAIARLASDRAALEAVAAVALSSL